MKYRILWSTLANTEIVANSYIDAEKIAKQQEKTGITFSAEQTKNCKWKLEGIYSIERLESSTRITFEK